MITEEVRSKLNAVFTPEEVFVAIQAMPNGKTPSPDGFPVEFSKKFWPEIQKTMPAINDILSGNTPSSWKYVSVSYY